MTASAKPRVALERWVQQGGVGKRRSIKCEYHSADMIWWVRVDLPNESDVYINTSDVDFHVAMEKALKALRRVEAHHKKYGTPSGLEDNGGKRRRSRRNGRWKVWTGPTQVRSAAEAFAQFPGVTDVYEGTEHVYFTYDGDLKDLTKVGVPARVRAYAIGLSEPGPTVHQGYMGIKPVRNGRKRTSRRARRTSRRAA